MSKIKRLFTLVFLALTLSVMLGVSSAQNTVTIDWWHIQTVDVERDYWQQVADDFMEANPGVEIEITNLENEAFKTQLVNVMQAGDHLIYSRAGVGVSFGASAKPVCSVTSHPN